MGIVGVQGCLGEALVVLEEIGLQEGVGGVEVVDVGQAQGLGEVVLEGLVDTFDAAFGLRRMAQISSMSRVLRARSS